MVFEPAVMKETDRLRIIARNPVKQAFLILNPPYILAPVLLECYRQKYSIFIGKEIYKKGRFLKPISY